MTTLAWPTRFSLQPGSVHIWQADVAPGADDDCLRVLDSAERTRWRRFRFERDQQQFLLAHGLVRHVLALYQETDPESLHFRHGAQGKPGLSDSDLAFNLSHSGAHCLMVVCRMVDVGIDVEVHREQRRFDSLARRCFDEQECLELETFSGNDYSQRFYDLWAMKEAVIKACGKGLALPLRDFGLRLSDRSDRLRLCWNPDLAEAGQNWRVLLFRGLAGASVALALRGDGANEIEIPQWFQCAPGISWSRAAVLPTLDSSSRIDIC